MVIGFIELLELVITSNYNALANSRTRLLSTESESESELLYDWWFTANHFVLATSPLRLTTSNFLSEHLR
jgi:hypothetical protein